MNSIDCVTVTGGRGGLFGNDELGGFGGSVTVSTSPYVEGVYV